MIFLQHIKIARFKNVFLDPILDDVDIGMQEENVRTDIDHIDYQCTQFQQFKEQSIQMDFSLQLNYMKL